MAKFGWNTTDTWIFRVSKVCQEHDSHVPRESFAPTQPLACWVLEGSLAELLPLELRGGRRRLLGSISGLKPRKNGPKILIFTTFLPPLFRTGSDDVLFAVGSLGRAAVEPLAGTCSVVAFLLFQPAGAHNEMALEWVSGVDFVCILHHFSS